MKTLSIKISNHGGPEVLKLEEEILSPPKASEVLIRHHAIGVNFVDTYYRSGLYPLTLPSGIGNEGAGVIEALGPDVKGFQVGDRVAYAIGGIGAYAEKRIIDSKFLVKLPHSISFEVAASSLLKAMTVHYLFTSVYSLKKGEKILFHAAAGGVGLIACQWAKHLGVDLIGTTSSAEKAELAKKAGAWEIINYKNENILERVLELTDGKKLPVVYDSVGKDTWETSLDCLSPKGLMVSFGNGSGPVTGVNLGLLAQKGSLYVTRPTLAHYVNNQDELARRASEVFSLIESGALVIEAPEVFALKDASLAHEELQNRNRVKTLVLKP